MTTKPPSSSKIHNLDLHDDWTANPAIDWIINHKSLLIGIFVGLVLALLLASRLITWRTLDAEKDYFQAQTAFTQFENAASSAPKENETAAADLQQLDAIMKRHPELKPKYQGALAQTLLLTGQVPQAETFIDDIFKRTEPDHLQPYQSYTQTSVLIEKTQYADALSQAQQLKERLDQQGKETNPTLYLFNLVRIALLHQQLSEPKQELKAWEELQSQNFDPEILLAVSEAFQIGSISLEQYILERNKMLNH